MNTTKLAPKSSTPSLRTKLRALGSKSPLAKLPPAQRWIFRAILAVLALYGLNALVLLCFAPHGIQSGEDSFGDADVRIYEQIQLGPLSVQSAGYVNMVSDERSFYISETLLQEDYAAWQDIAYRHEYFHLIQRDLVAEAAGGYPSYSNPLQSFYYYFQLLRLNADLAPLMPSSPSAPLIGGLEGSADCYAQPQGTAANPATYMGVYIGENICDSAQIWVVQQMAQGHWPSAPAQTTALPEVFVEVGYPGQSAAELKLAAAELKSTEELSAKDAAKAPREKEERS